MLMFTVAISCLTTLNLLWYVDLAFRVHMQYCSLQHQSLLPSPVTSTTGCCFHFGSIPSFFLELFLHSSPVAYWAPTNLGSLPFSVSLFFLFILFMGFSRQEYWSGLPFPSPLDHVLSDLSAMTCLSWADYSCKKVSVSLFPSLTLCFPRWIQPCRWCSLLQFSIQWILKNSLLCFLISSLNKLFNKQWPPVL